MRWIELLNNISLLYYPCKENIVADALNRLSMGCFAPVQEDKKKFVRDVHRLARLGFRFVNSNESGLFVHNGS